MYDKKKRLFVGAALPYLLIDWTIGYLGVFIIALLKSDFASVISLKAIYINGFYHIKAKY